MPAKKSKKRDFDKKKLKVGKSKPLSSNATNTSFSAKSISLPSQLAVAGAAGSSITSHINLTRHHQAIARRQAVVQLSSTFNSRSGAAHQSQIVSAVAPLVVDDDRTVRQAALEFFSGLDPAVLSPFVAAILLYVQSAMTHISPAIRSEATLFLDVLLKQAPSETVRLGFAKTLRLFFPLLGWRFETGTQADAVTATMSFGKSAAKTKLVHLQSLHLLLSTGLAPPAGLPPVLFAADTFKFMLPNITNPFAMILGSRGGDANITDDVDARRVLVDELRAPLAGGLAATQREGGETGRLAGRVASLVAATA